MDNFRFDITAEGDKRLAQAMEIAFMRAAGGKAVAYAVRPAVQGERYPADDPAPHMRNREKVAAKPLRLVFYWNKPHRPDDLTLVALPFSLDAAGAADFAIRWLREQEYGCEPDHDGDNRRGWRLYNESWGHVDNDYSAFVAVAPAWALYGK